MMSTLFSAAHADDCVYWFCNIDQEQSWNHSKVFPSVTDATQSELVRQQEQQLLLLARPGQHAILRHSPDPVFLRYLEQAGIALPQIEVHDDIPWVSLVEGALLVPYIMNEEIKSRAHAHQVEVLGSTVELTKRLNNKFIVRRWAIEHGFAVTNGYFCRNADELHLAYEELKRHGHDRCVLKIPFGSSGKGMRVIDCDRSFQHLKKFITRRATEFELLLEGWHPIARSLNAQMWIGPDAVQLLCVTEQQIDGNGVYQGTNFTPCYDPVMLSVYEQEILRAGGLLQEMGYKGIVGVDSIVDTDGLLVPVIEINARFTQVTYLLPVVEALRERNSFIESRYVRLETEEPLGFTQLYERLRVYFETEGEDPFLIYTFASCKADDKTLYRLFVLFFGNERSDVVELCRKFASFPLSYLNR